MKQDDAKRFYDTNIKLYFLILFSLLKEHFETVYGETLVYILTKSLSVDCRLMFFLYW